jgi:hypothetical protein
LPDDMCLLRHSSFARDLRDFPPRSDPTDGVI